LDTLSKFLNVTVVAGNQYWCGLRKPPCQFLFSVCPCLQLFGNVSYSLYSNNNNNNNNGEPVPEADIDIFPGIGEKKKENFSCLQVPVPF
jgi:hypothetical protein